VKRLIALGVSIGTCLAVAACSSSGSSNSAGGSSSDTAGAKSITIGLLTDSTGPASAAHVDDQAATQAYFDYVNAHGGVNGVQLKLKVADTTSTPTGAQTAAQKLVQDDKVFAIVEDSLLFFGASPYLVKSGVPVVGSGIDGPEWFQKSNTNLFTPEGQVFNTTQYYPQADGEYMKARGVTSCAAVGYAGQPSSSHAATGFTNACKDVGLKVGYLNTQVPIGSTDIGPIALAIKASGADGIALEMQESTSILIMTRLGQLGVHPKSALLAEGYGPALLDNEANRQAAQGIDFSTVGYPDEVDNAATKLRRTILTAGGLKMPPSPGSQYSYLNALTLVDGLKAAGATTSQTTFISKLRAVTDFDADGLLPGKTDFSASAPTTSCLTIVRLTGDKFVPMQPLPLCAPEKKF
jgi:branched-chain amino acid transport system substrate-binding protein